MKYLKLIRTTLIFQRYAENHIYEMSFFSKKKCSMVLNKKKLFKIAKMKDYLMYIYNHINYLSRSICKRN